MAPRLWWLATALGQLAWPRAKVGSSGMDDFTFSDAGLHLNGSQSVLLRAATPRYRKYRQHGCQTHERRLPIYDNLSLY